MFENFTDRAIKTIMLAQDDARRRGNGFVGTEQVLLGLIEEETSLAARLLAERGVTLEQARAEVDILVQRGSGLTPAEVRFTPKANRIFGQALQIARQLGERNIGPEHLLLSLLQDDESVAAKVLKQLDIDQMELQAELLQHLNREAVPAGDRAAVSERPKTKLANRKTPILQEFGTDLTQLAAAGKLDPMVGRQETLERVIQILGRRTKNNPVLIGEPGVGKSAIAEGLAQRMFDRDVPPFLVDKRLVSLDLGAMVAGTQFRGEFEARLTQLVQEISQANNIVLMIDEVHTLLGAGALQGGTDAANLLKPALARGELQCIGATTLDEYRQYIERDAALERRFQPVNVKEPSVAETIEILHGLRGRYEQHHRVEMTDAALEAAARLSDRYIADRYLPDKAIDLIDEAGSRVRLRHARRDPANQELQRELRQIIAEKQAAVEAQVFDRAQELRDRERTLEAQLNPLGLTSSDRALNSIQPPLVDIEDIAQIVSTWTGIPASKLTESESARLLQLEDTLHQRIIGQTEAVTAVARAIRRTRVGLSNPNRPIASFIFSGPTGVGKTELAKALAVYLFGSEDAMIRLDMSEYMERQTVAKLIGSPPGFIGYDEGGQLTEAIRRRPYSIVLLDEIEKAHPDVFNLLLQVLEDGRLTDSQGRIVDFSHTLLILTSNLGSQSIAKGGSGLGFELQSDNAGIAQYQRLRTAVNESLKQFFRPEFLNRLDEIVVFQSLTKEEIKQIAALMLQDIASRLQERDIELEITDSFTDRAVTVGYNRSYGARALRRTLTQLLEDNLAEAILAGQLQAGDTAVVEVDADGQVHVQAKKIRVRELQSVT